MSRVFILSSGNIFRNLAFEFCLSKVSKASRPSSASPHTGVALPSDLLIWRSDPCVVIGRFQNAWQEVDTRRLRSRGWPLARRHSGGGAVFHDRGNLNISFMETKDSLDRAERMRLLQAILQPFCREKSVHVGPRFDLWVSEPAHDSSENASNWLKISGSSSRIGNTTAYHHCTLLCSANLKDLADVLVPTFKTLQTKATQSVRSNVVNLHSDVELVQLAIITGYLNWVKQRNSTTSLSAARVIHVAEGEEEMYVCAETFQQELRNLGSWSWIYGASPAFTIDLDEVEPGLSEIGRFHVSCGRGGLVTSVTGPTDSQIHQSGFMDHLSESLTGVSCQTNFWDGALDRISAVWSLNRSLDGQLTADQQLVLSALRRVSSRL